MRNVILLYILLIILLLSFAITGLIGCGGESKEAEEKGGAGPSISSAIPKDGAKNVPTTAAILVIFDKDIATPSTTNLIFTPSVSGAVSYETSTRTLVFKPSAALSNYTDYSMEINGITDLEGNAMSPVTINFTTSVPDTTGPSITLTSPENDQKDIGHDAKILVRFSEPVDKGKFRSSISFDPKVDLPADKWQLVWATGANEEVTISPPPGVEPYAVDEEYTMLLSKGSVLDLSGNPMTTDYKLRFRTLRYPVEKIGNPNFSSPAIEPQWIYNVGRLGGTKWAVIWGGKQPAGGPSGSSPSGTITASADGQISDSVEKFSTRGEETVTFTVTSGNGNRLTFQTPSLDNQKKFRIIFSSTSSYITFELRSSAGTISPQYVHIGNDFEHPSRTPFILKNK